MKFSNLSKITKYIKFPKFSIKIKTFLMLGLFIFYLAMIISDFYMKTFEYFTPQEQSEINTIKNRLNRADFQIRMEGREGKRNRDVTSKTAVDNYNIMTKLIPDIQKNIIDLSNNLRGIESKIEGIQPSSIQPFDASSSIIPIDASLNITPI